MNEDIHLIRKYFPDLNDFQEECFMRLGPLYREWNERINLISRKDIESLYEKHILHSLSIARIVSFRPGTRILDVGTGGGFPGIPLAIMFPDVHFHLVDSIGKKIRVVQAIAYDLKMSNVFAEQCRAEQLKGKYDFVVSRAVTTLSEFTGWTSNRIDPVSRNAIPNGILYLKGGDLTAELRPFGRRAVIYSLSEVFTEDFFETKKLVYLPGR